jgi:hypothetical protein
MTDLSQTVLERAAAYFETVIPAAQPSDPLAALAESFLKSQGGLKVAPDAVFQAAFRSVPDPWQSLMLNDRVGTLAVTTRQAGKTATASCKAGIIAAEGSVTHPDAVVVIAAPSFRQSARVLARIRLLWRRLDTVALGLPNIVNRDPSRILFDGGGLPILALPDNPDTIRGETAAYILIEESAFCRAEIHEVIRPMVAASGGFIDQISSAGLVGSQMHRDWQAQTPGLRLEVPWQDVPRMDRAFIEGERARLPRAVFEREYECVWGSGRGGLFTADDLGFFIQGNLMADVWA